MPVGCECGAILVEEASVVQKSVPENALQDLVIPKHYKANRWDRRVLQQDNLELMDDNPLFDRYVQQLHEGYNIVKQGGLFQNSMLIVSPAGYSKTTWAYSCILSLYEHGYSCVPLLDTTELKRMLYTKSENPNWRVAHLGKTVDEYINADVLFLNVTRGTEFEYAYEVLVNILDMRSRMDKPTMILSDYTLKQLTVYDMRGTFKSLVSRRGANNVNPYRYLCAIDFNDRKDAYR